jgi:hypothetical protein
MKKWVKNTGGSWRGDKDKRVNKTRARFYPKFQWSLQQCNDEGDAILFLEIQLPWIL